MADIIRADSAELQQCASKYLSALATLKDAYAAYTKSLNALRSDWTGRAFVIMSGKVATMGINIAKSFEKLTDAVSELNEVRELNQETESGIKSQIGNQQVGNESPFNAG